MIYLDNAATSYPKPEKVYEEVMQCMKQYGANPGRGSHDMSVKAASIIMEAREEICKLFHIQSPFQVVFTCNATEALNIGVKGVVRKGDHVISTMIEHNSVLRPLYALHEEGVEVTLIGVDKAGYLHIEDIQQEIRRNTKLIIINHVSNVLGSIQDIRAIGRLAREHGVLFMVDASQSAGILPIDVGEDCIDLLAFPGHKGLWGIQGTGGLYIREGLQLKNFKEGGTGSNSHFMQQPDFLPDQFESGTLNTPGIAGLCRGIQCIQEIGIHSIHTYEKELTAYLLEELKKRKGIQLYGNPDIDQRTAVVSFNMEGMDAAAVGEQFNQRGIAVRTGYHCAPLIHEVIGTENMGTVRVSMGYFNTMQHIEELMEAIIQIGT